MKKTKIVLNEKNGTIKTNGKNKDSVDILKNLGINFPISSVVKHTIPLKSKSLTQIEKDIIHIENIYKNCQICNNNCGVNRMNGEIGICGNPVIAKIYKNQIEYDEEKYISPSYLIYFSGCNMECKFCHQKDEMMFDKVKSYISYDKVIADIKNNISKISTISFIGGNPEQSILGILKFIELLLKEHISIPLVWNSNLTCKPEIIEILNKYIEIFIPDIKFGNDKCAKKIAKVENYWSTIKRNILIISDEFPVIIRHLPLKGHLQCCSIPIMEFLQTLKSKFYLNFLHYFQENNQKGINFLKNKYFNGKIKIL